MASKSNLDLIQEGDSFPYDQNSPPAYPVTGDQQDSFYRLRVGKRGYDVGYVPPSVVRAIDTKDIPGWVVSRESHLLVLQDGNTADERSSIVANTNAILRESGSFSALDGWRDELYPVYGRERNVEGGLLFRTERSASCLFGIVTYGVHMTAYVPGGHGPLTMRIWVPRRARTKQTYAGLLDNSVAGGIEAGERPFESIVREAGEEASLPPDRVRQDIQAAGCITYFHVRDERAGGESGLLQPECQYVFDLPVPEGLQLHAGDDEVEQFYLWTITEVQDALAAGEFKPNCALVLLDFFIRHGILDSKEEEDYIEIVSRLHRKLPFPTFGPRPTQ